MISENIIKLEQMKRYFFDQDTTKKFIHYLISKGSVIAPHRKGECSYTFERVIDVNDVEMVYPRTIQPLKKFLLPPAETLISFNIKDQSFQEGKIEDEKMIFFAVHAYDMQGVLRLDYNFTKGNPESNYLKRRENCCFIGISYDPDDFHFSKSVGIEIEKMEGFCLFFEPVENGYLVFEVNEKGKEMLSEFGIGILVDTPMDFEVKKKSFSAKIKYHYNRLPQVFNYIYHSKVELAVQWQREP